LIRSCPADYGSLIKRSRTIIVENVIFDISGVLILDTIVSNALFQIIKALKMAGVETIITGVRPSIAQTITRIGITFHDVKTLGRCSRPLQNWAFKK
jgi:rsbT co-antagonist protein RsbR